MFILNNKNNHYIHFQKDEQAEKISWHMKKISSLKEENHCERSEHMISNCYGKLETFLELVEILNEIEENFTDKRS